MKKACYLIVLTLFLCFFSGSKTKTGKGSIHLTVEACKSDRGKIMIAVYNSAETYMDEEKAVLKKVIRIQNKKAVLQLDELPFGAYALVCYHDENSNHRLDKNMIGIPKEGFGFSNNIKPVLGPPGFSKCSFQLNQSDYYTTIKLLYF